MTRFAYNSTDSPVVVDSQGRTLGGGEWGSVDDSLSIVKSAVENGQVVFVDDQPAKDSNPQARDAWASFKKSGDN